MKSKKKLLGKRILSLLLPMTLLISSFSVPVYAEDKLPKESSLKENTVDKSPLEDEIKKAEELNEKQYSKETWNKLQQALTSARELLKNPDATSEQIKEEVEKIEEAIKALEKIPYVYFKYDDGRIQQMDENDTFTLSALDEGNFVLEGTDKKADWDCFSEIGYVNKHFWISGSSGRYMPYNVAKVDATVKNKDNLNEVLKTFHINNVSTNVEELKLFVGDQEVSVDNPYQSQGSETLAVTVKGKVKGKEELVTIPASAALSYDKESGSGFIDSSGNFQISNNKEAVFTVSLVENGISAKFKVTSNHVPLKSFSLTVPKVWYIHEWNGLGGYYLGIMQGTNPDKNFQVKFEPENASNKELLWKALTPDIAEYMEAFHNGIIPKKAGIARFEVSSVENPQIKQEVVVEFKYKYPLKTATVEKDTFELEQGEYINFKINTAPKDASEQRFKWSYSKEGIVRVGDTVNIDPSNVSTPKETIHTLTTLEPGVVTVTGVPLDQTAGCEPIQFKVKVYKDGVVPGEPEESTYLSLAKKDIKHGLDALKKYKQESYGDEWNIFTILRAGEKISQENLDKYYESVKKQVKENSKDMRATDLARVIITLEAMGKDPSNVGGINLLEKLYSSENMDKETSNCHIWSLIALDAWKSEIPSDARWTREKLIEKILSFQTEEGGFGLFDNKSSSIDMTGMALQSLAPYYNNDKYPEVRKAVDKSLSYLKSQKTGNAGYIDGGSENSCSTAQVLTALAALNIDPVKEESGFTSNLKNIITNLDGYKAETGFGINNAEGSNGMATQQVTYALVAYQRMMEGRNGLYDITDVKPEKPSVTPDEEKANKVVEAIDGIGEVTLESKDKIVAARRAYEELTETQKNLVINYDKLVKAEEELKKLEEAEAQQQLDKEKANKVIEAIDGIGEVTLESKDKIVAVREAYEGLTETQKNLVINYDKLVKAEEELKKLDNSNSQQQDNDNKEENKVESNKDSQPIGKNGDE